MPGAYLIWQLEDEEFYPTKSAGKGLNSCSLQSEKVSHALNLKYETGGEG